MERNVLKKFLSGERCPGEKSVPDMKREIIRMYESQAAAFREELGEPNPLASEITRLNEEVERLQAGLGVIDGKLHRAADLAADSVTMRIDHTNIIERLNDICGDVAEALRNKDQQ